MPSRKKRKRDRRRAEATASSSRTHGGWGNGLPVDRGDLLLVRRAIRYGWPVPPEVRQAVVDDLCASFDKCNEDDRFAMAVCRTVIAMEGENQALEHAEQDRTWATDSPPTASG
ncbi:hypothetical protein [Adhaeretor mobilis]|uniref:Uncharacterized protein n=1 Tax=Adhaeretor mobilis TaxID=1930276 RepID=A0A517MYI3_9BACT|nr:hypothetical protein [Adhaeretor mobilis]QDS99950.1 hypothetical protein HG15A2_32840 [Adhaeretor mobilis]